VRGGKSFSFAAQGRQFVKIKLDGVMKGGRGFWLVARAGDFGIANAKDTLQDLRGVLVAFKQ